MGHKRQNQAMLACQSVDGSLGLLCVCNSTVTCSFLLTKVLTTRKGSNIKHILLLIRTRLMCCRNHKCTVIPDCDGDSVDVVLATSIKHWSKCVLRKCYFLQLQFRNSTGSIFYSQHWKPVHWSTPRKTSRAVGPKERMGESEQKSSSHS